MDPLCDSSGDDHPVCHLVAAHRDAEPDAHGHDDPGHHLGVHCARAVARAWIRTGWPEHVRRGPVQVLLWALVVAPGRWAEPVVRDREWCAGQVTAIGCWKKLYIRSILPDKNQKNKTSIKLRETCALFTRPCPQK